MCTIYGFDKIGLPVSTTHVLSSVVAGTMMAGAAAAAARGNETTRE